MSEKIFYEYKNYYLKIKNLLYLKYPIYTPNEPTEYEIFLSTEETFPVRTLSIYDLKKMRTLFKSILFDYLLKEENFFYEKIPVSSKNSINEFPIFEFKKPLTYKLPFVNSIYRLTLSPFTEASYVIPYKIEELSFWEKLTIAFNFIIRNSYDTLHNRDMIPFIALFSGFSENSPWISVGELYPPISDINSEYLYTFFLLKKRLPKIFALKLFFILKQNFLFINDNKELLDKWFSLYKNLFQTIINKAQNKCAYEFLLIVYEFFSTLSKIRSVERIEKSSSEKTVKMYLIQKLKEFSPFLNYLLDVKVEPIKDLCERQKRFMFSKIQCKIKNTKTFKEKLK